MTIIMSEKSELEAELVSQLKTHARVRRGRRVVDWAKYPEPHHNPKGVIPGRRYKPDFYWDDSHQEAYPHLRFPLAVEVQGGIYVSRCSTCQGKGRMVNRLTHKSQICRSCNGEGKGRGAHGRAWGMERDMEKQAVFLAHGIPILPVNAKVIHNGDAVKWIQWALEVEAYHK